MKPKAVFVDYKPEHARAQGDQLDPAEDARLFQEPEAFDDSPKRLRALRRQIADVHNATCNAFATLGLPLKLRAFVPVIIAAYALDERAVEAGGNTFRASYATLVSLTFRQGDGRTFEAKKSEVRRLLEKLKGWQDANTTLCTIRQGGRSRGKNGKDVYHDTEFDLVLLDGLAKALARNPAPERMRAAVRVEIAEMMKLPAFDSRWGVKPPDLREVQRRDRKAAIFKAAKAALAESVLGGDAEAYADELARVMKQAARLAPAKLAELRDRSPHLTPQEAADRAIRAAIEEVQSGPDAADLSDSTDTPPDLTFSDFPAPVTADTAQHPSEGGVSDSTHPEGSPGCVESAEIAPKEKTYKVLKPEAEAPFEHTPEDHAAFESVARCVRGSQPFNVSEVELCVGSESVEELEAEAIRDEAGGSVLLE